MALQASVKKTRALSTSTAQYETLLSYMESHSEFAAGKFLTKEGKIHHSKQWEELANRLNALSNNAEKTTKQWQTVWRDMKSIASKKASKLRNERHRTGNFPITAQLLSTIDQRVIACIGLEYVQGSVNCPDSTPEEDYIILYNTHTEYQLRLERGETEVLYDAPTTISIEDINIDTHTSISRKKIIRIIIKIYILRYTYLPSTYEENGVFEHMEIEEASNKELCYNDVVNSFRERNIEETSATENVAPNSQTIPLNQRRTQEIQRNRKNRQRIGVQLQEARENFTDIAEKHAEALQIFAEASMKQAENDSQRIILEEERLEIEEKRIKIEEQISRVLANVLDKLN